MKTLWNRTTALVLSVYFVQGFMIIGGISEFLLTKNLFEFSWIQIAMLGALSTLAWTIKPLFGFLTDLLPLMGSRRKYYLYIASILPMLGYLGLTFFGTSFLPIALFLVLSNIGLGLADVIADGIIVESTTKKEVGKLQALSWRTKAFGIFFGSIFSGLILSRKTFSSLLENTGIPDFLSTTLPTAFPSDLILGSISMIDIRGTFFAMAMLPIITLVATYFFQEKKVQAKTLKAAHKDLSAKYVFSALIAFAATAITLVGLSLLKTPALPFIDNAQLSSLLVIAIWSIWIFFYARHLVEAKATTTTLLWAAAFLFLWRFTPTFGAPWQNYYLNELSINQESMGLVSSLQPLAWIIGSFIYVKFLDKIPLKKLLFWTVIVAFCADLTDVLTATPAWGMYLGDLWFIKGLSTILLTPTYLLVHGGGAWTEILAQPSILHLAGVTTFIMEMAFIISFIPLLKLAAVVTPKGVEATNFAVLASVMNLGLAFGAIFGGILYTHIEGTHSIGSLEFTGLHIAVILGALTSLVCLSILKKVEIND